MSDKQFIDKATIPTADDIFQRAALVLGHETMQRLAALRVIIFGVGGVGSWCAEGLVRSGVGHLTLVDCHVVCVSNINRQLMATASSVGSPKVDVLRRRLMDINPHADIVACQKVYCQATAASFDLDGYDFVIDAIDSLQDKALLILRACASKSRLFSSMGAALKIDPSHIRVAEFWRVQGDPLARALRRRFKGEGCLPSRKFQCVYSDEVPRPNLRREAESGVAASSDGPRANGSLVHITAIFGFTLASLVVRATEEE